MEQKKPISNLVAGGLIGGILVVFALITFFAGIEDAGIIGLLPLVIIIVGLIIFINLYGKSNNSQVTFGNLFGYGFKTTAIVILIIIFFTVILILLFPEIKEKGFEAARREMEKKGNLTQDEIDKGLEIMHRMFWVFTIGRILLGCAIVGAVGSVIGAAITKKKPVNPMDQLSI